LIVIRENGRLTVRLEWLVSMLHLQLTWYK